MLADQPTFLREAPTSPPRRIYERRLQVAVGVFCLLVLGLFWASLLTYLNQVETTAADQAQRDVSNLTLAVEEQVKRTILGLDQVMLFADLNFDQLPSSADLIRWAAHIPHLTGVSVQIAVANTQGDIVASTLPLPDTGTVSITDRGHFRIQLDQPDTGLFISRPMLGRVSGRWSIQLTRRLNNADGKLIGVIVLSLDPDYFQQTFAMLDVGSGGAVTLFRDDGYILARSPALHGMHGHNTSEEPAHAELYHRLKHTAVVSGRVRSPLDGSERVASFRKVSGLPLVVGISRSVEEVLAPVRDTRQRILWLGALASLFFITLAAGLIAELNRRQHQTVQLRRAKEAADQARQTANEAREAEARFLATMSHELRTPLNGIIGFTNLLLETRLDQGQREHFARLAHDAGRSLLVIVNDVLDFSKLEAGKLTLDPKPLDLSPLAQSCCRLMEPMAAEKGLTLNLDLAPDLPAWVMGDEQRLRQILLNLLNNAIKFTERGSITAAVSNAGEGGGSPTRIRFSVADTGIGIPQDKLGLLFNRFAQLDSSNTRPFGGAGLGLAISKQLVERMGGTIGVTSTPGEGSTFWFEVPLPETQAPAMVSQRSPVPITGRESRPARVLLAEDLTTNQILITAILKRAGHQVDVVETGAAAVEAVQRQVYDLILMDVQMPVMDGLEATRKIRTLEGRVTNIPVVALTASVLEQDVEACRAAGMGDFVAKPIDADALLAAVARWVLPKPADSSAPLREAQSHEAFLVDREKLQRLRNRIGEQLGPLIERCVDDAERPCRSIAAPEVRLEDIIRDAHNLKGTSGMLGLARISQLSGEIQARASDRRLVDHLAAELNEIVTATRTELRSTGLMPSDTDALG